MQRPIMDPLFLQDDPEPSARLAINWHRLRAPLRGVGWLVSVLFTNPLRRRRRRPVTHDLGPFGQLVREATSRLVFLPLLVAVSVAALVYGGTHPPTPPQGLGPESVGLYYDAVDFTSEDATRLRGWIVPAIDARRVLEGGDRLLRTRHPGIVLAHDYGQSPSQFLPLLAPLHEEGFDVLVVGLRGVGLGRPVGQTFGVNESKDIAAAVQVLRGHPSVDPSRIAVLGVGTGANAALLASDRDPRIAALALANPVGNCREAVSRYIGPSRWPLGWMQPLCRWAWEIGYRIGPDEIDLSRYQGTLVANKTFCADNVTQADGSLSPKFVRQVTEFFAERLCGTN
jgi:alpha-beta hydrolase superfamily lysophospholipase